MRAAKAFLRLAKLQREGVGLLVALNQRVLDGLILRRNARRFVR